jgi:ubiquitin C-terminal hydrolase
MQMNNQNNNMNNNNMNNNNMSNNNFGMQMNNQNNNMNNNMNNNNMSHNNFGMQMRSMNNNNNQINNNNNNMINPNFSMPNMQFNNNEVKYSFSRYTKAPKTSLKNLYDTSYLNAVLQLFATVRNVASYFVNPTNVKYFNDNKVSIPFSYVFHRLFIHFYPYPEKNSPEKYSPEVLLDVLGRYNKIYQSKKSRNPNDLIIFILCTLHKELNKYKTKYISSPDPTNKNEVIKEGMNDFKKSNQSIISNNFHWFELKGKFCSGCIINYYSFNNFETLDLDIAGTFQQCNSPINLLQCLNYQSQKQQNIFCEKCQKYTKFQINTKIYSSPITFIFTLNRGNADEKLLNIKFIVEDKIDIGKFLETPKAYNKFELIGVASYNLNDKKYVCFGRSPCDKQWCLYNDENVIDTNINEVLNCNNNMGYIPCILIYQFMK